MHSCLFLNASPLQDESGKSKHLFFCKRSVPCICLGNTRRKSDDRDEGRRRTEEREEGGRRWGEDLRREDQAETRRRSEDREDGRRRMSRLRSGDSLVDDEVLDSENNKHSVFSNISIILISGYQLQESMEGIRVVEVEEVRTI